MNTTEYKDAVAAKVATKLEGKTITKEDMSTIIDACTEVSMEALTKPDEDNECKLVIRGFGTLKVVPRKGRTYNVRGKQVTVGDRKTVTFKPGTDLVKAITIS